MPGEMRSPVSRAIAFDVVDTILLRTIRKSHVTVPSYEKVPLLTTTSPSCSAMVFPGFRYSNGPLLAGSRPVLPSFVPKILTLGQHAQAQLLATLPNA